MHILSRRERDTPGQEMGTAMQYRTNFNYNYNRSYLRICHTTPQQEAAQAQATGMLCIGLILLVVAFNVIHSFWEEQVPLDQLNIATQVSSTAIGEVDGPQQGGYTVNAQIHNASALMLTRIQYTALLLSCPNAQTPNSNCAVITTKDGSITTNLAPNVSGHFSTGVGFDNESQYDGQHRVEVHWAGTVGERPGYYFAPKRLQAAFAYHFGGQRGG